MNLFSEIYGAYFRTAGKIMEKETVSEGEIYDCIKENAFRDSVLFLPKKLIPGGDGSDWGLLKKTGGGRYARVTKNPPVSVVTALQKSWLKAKISDPKMRLFMSDEEISRLDKRLADVTPLYRQENIRYTDIFSDGDNISDEGYISRFRLLLGAVKNKEAAEIAFTSRNGGRKRGIYFPVRIEYSRKNDKFRLYALSVKDGRIRGSVIINLGRITEVKLTGTRFEKDISLDRFFASGRCKEPVTVKVTTARNAVERFMMEFAGYEKYTERDMETGVCTVKLMYDKNDETELLIRLLSFGPAIEILAPEDFRHQAAERIEKQYELLFGV